MAKKEITKPVKLINAYDLFLPDEKSDKVFIVAGRGGDKAVQLATELLKRKVADAPAVDAVEVVRCKDCLNAHLINNYPYCELWNFVMARDNYCSFGKRKENE